MAAPECDRIAISKSFGQNTYSDFVSKHWNPPTPLRAPGVWLGCSFKDSCNAIYGHSQKNRVLICITFWIGLGALVLPKVWCARGPCPRLSASRGGKR